MNKINLSKLNVKFDEKDYFNECLSNELIQEVASYLTEIKDRSSASMVCKNLNFNVIDLTSFEERKNIDEFIEFLVKNLDSVKYSDQIKVLNNLLKENKTMKSLNEIKETSDSLKTQLFYILICVKSKDLDKLLIDETSEYKAMIDLAKIFSKLKNAVLIYDEKESISHLIKFPKNSIAPIMKILGPQKKNSVIYQMVKELTHKKDFISTKEWLPELTESIYKNNAVHNLIDLFLSHGQTDEASEYLENFDSEDSWDANTCKKAISNQFAEEGNFEKASQIASIITDEEMQKESFDYLDALKSTPAANSSTTLAGSIVDYISSFFS